MAKSSDEKKRDEALKRALKMPPQPHGAKIDKPPTDKKVDGKKKLAKKKGRTRHPER